MREIDHGTPDTFPPGRDDCKSQDPDFGRFLRLLWQASPRPLAARLEPKESLAGTSETIPGCEKGEEGSPCRENGNRPGERTLPRTPLLLPATASSAEPGNPPLSTGETSHQVDFFPAPLLFSSRAARASRGRGKGSLTLAVLPLLARLARRGRSRVLLLSRTRGTRGACLSRTSRRRPSRPATSRRFPRNPGRMEGTLNKSIVGCSTHLGQRRVQKG